ncbi:MAG: hypothetical protein KJ949_03590 [Nanoarchaeota archaeon]|nr:hypothetical protein [Nanoarchaeota archaeon]
MNLEAYWLFKKSKKVSKTILGNLFCVGYSTRSAHDFSKKEFLNKHSSSGVPRDIEIDDYILASTSLLVGLGLDFTKLYIFYKGLETLIK